MYFPRNFKEMGHFLTDIERAPISLKLDYVNQALRAMIEYKDDVDTSVIRLLQDYRLSLIEMEKSGVQHSENFSELLRRNQQLENKVSELMRELYLQKENSCNYISFEMKEYSKLYIFLLSHPKNNSSATAEILSRINYLDKMTRNVIFVMPGYQRATENDKVIDIMDQEMQLTFDEGRFMSIIQSMEDESNGKFAYTDKCELVFFGSNPNGGIDYSEFTRLDLNLLFKKRGIDPIQLILNISNYFRNHNDKIDIKKSINQILGEMTMTEERQTLRVFIAGSKAIKEERSLLREELSKIENTLNLDIRALTFEDFATSLTGEEETRQDQYNAFIRNEADVTVFVFDSKVGDITLKEFEVAYESLQSQRRPEIFVYSKKAGIFTCLRTSRKLKEIKEKFFGPNKEYYVEYTDLVDLRYQFHRNMIGYLQSRKQS